MHSKIWSNILDLKQPSCPKYKNEQLFYFTHEVSIESWRVLKLLVRFSIQNLLKLKIHTYHTLKYSIQYHFNFKALSLWLSKIQKLIHFSCPPHRTWGAFQDFQCILDHFHTFCMGKSNQKLYNSPGFNPNFMSKL